MKELTASATRLARARSQLLLHPRSALTPAEVAARVVGINAQRRGIVELSAHARAAGLREADIERARVEERSLVRAWFMRYTLHTVSAEDAGWLLGLLGPVLAARADTRRAQLGVDCDLADRGVRVIERELAARGPLTRAELGEALVRAGLPIDPATQALVHLIALASLRGLVCSGPWREGKETHVLLRDWTDAGGPLVHETALAELGRRYLAAFAPATPHDFAKWSGLAVGAAREAWRLLAGELAEVRFNGAPAWVLAREEAEALRGAPSGTPSVRLLPAFDDYLIGWRTRDLIVAAGAASEITPGGAMFANTVVADGLIVATWQLLPGATTIDVRPFAPLGDAVSEALAAEVTDLGRFLGRRTTLQMTPPRL